LDALDCRVRSAEPSDIGALGEIDALAYGRPGREAQLERFCREDNRQLLVILASQSPCGYLAYSQVLDEASIEDVVVDPQCQGTGLGRQLLQASFEDMKRRGAAICLLEVRASNAAAIALYRSCGFQLDGERRNYYPAEHGRENALLMSRQL
jgi:ribosomal-protein-alanine N-acetyltransferase